MELFFPFGRAHPQPRSKAGAAAFTLRVATTSVSHPAGDESSTLPISTGASRDTSRISFITSRIFAKGIGRFVLTLTRGKSPPRTGALDEIVRMGFSTSWRAHVSPRGHVFPCILVTTGVSSSSTSTTIVQPPGQTTQVNSRVFIPPSPPARSIPKELPSSARYGSSPQGGGASPFSVRSRDLRP